MSWDVFLHKKELKKARNRGVMGDEAYDKL
jgi:hypothetical protein